ncbi:hypothetical protein SAMN04488098_102723 [Alkalibacterium thalassium]|uniref:Uncharacterized protein n=1 Tax=Alkalibacterium thalassium TaxID=426701 RepID=A0A1G9BJU7_9LACT|nr:hypothetical protein SAMN04488098_102723 [Alkalibacterium thalassium]
MSTLNNTKNLEVILYLLAPVIGLSYSMIYDSITVLPLIMLFTYLYGLKRVEKNSQSARLSRWGTFILVLIPLSYFSFIYSLFSLVLLSSTALLLWLKPQFQTYNLVPVFNVIKLFLLIVIMNAFAFYSQTLFITARLILFLIILCVLLSLVYIKNRVGDK